MFSQSKTSFINSARVCTNSAPVYTNSGPVYKPPTGTVVSSLDKRWYCLAFEVFIIIFLIMRLRWEPTPTATVVRSRRLCLLKLLYLSRTGRTLNW